MGVSYRLSLDFDWLLLLSQGSSLIHQKVAPPSEGVGSPVLSFIQLEQFNAVRLVQSIHQSLASLSKVIRGTSLLTADVHKLATALLNQEVRLNACTCSIN